MKKIIVSNILLFLTIAIVSNVYGKIYHFTLLEKTRRSEIVLLAKCIKIKNDKYKLQFLGKFPEKVRADRFAIYKIIGVWKGRFNKDTIVLDYKLTNKKYKPFICNFPVHPIIDEQVILFVEKDFAIFGGFQGKIQVNKENISLYKDAIRKFLELDTLSNREKVLAIIKMVDDTNQYVKESMIRELFEIDNTEYGFEIAKLLKHKDRLVRQRAISVLVRTQEKGVVPFIIDRLKNDENPKVREEATTVLWRIDDKRIDDALMEAFSDKDPNVRRGAIFALSRRNNKEAIPFYLKALKDIDPLVRAYGANAFEWVAEPKAFPELINALKDKDPNVRSSAIRTLYVWIRCNIIEPNNEIIKLITPSLSDKNWDVRDQSAYFFAVVGWRGYKDIVDSKIIDKLSQIIKTDENNQVRNTAVMALKAIDSKRAKKKK